MTISNSISFIGLFKSIITALSIAFLFILNHSYAEQNYFPELQAKQTFLLSQNVNDNGLIREFNDLQSQLKTTSDPLEEGRGFFHSYIKQINNHYGLSITVEEACQIAKHNLSRMDLPPELYEKVSEIIDQLSIEKNPQSPNVSFYKDEKNTTLRVPWELYWPGNNTEKISTKEKISLSEPPVSLSINISEIPGIFPFVVGIVEGTIGAIVFPFNPVAGGILIGDGFTRVVQGVQENLQGNFENRTEPSYNRLNFPRER